MRSTVLTLAMVVGLSLSVTQAASGQSITLPNGQVLPRTLPNVSAAELTKRLEIQPYTNVPDSQSSILFGAQQPSGRSERTAPARNGFSLDPR